MLSWLDKLPEGVELSPHLVEKADGFVSVACHCEFYYFPVTAEIKRLIGKRDKNSYNTRCCVERLLMDLVSAVYLQIRDGLVEELKDELSDQVAEGLKKLYVPQLNNLVDNKIKMLEEGNK